MRHGQADFDVEFEGLTCLSLCQAIRFGCIKCVEFVFVTALLFADTFGTLKQRKEIADALLVGWHACICAACGNCQSLSVEFVRCTSRMTTPKIMRLQSLTTSVMSHTAMATGVFPRGVNFQLRPSVFHYFYTVPVDFVLFALLVRSSMTSYASSSGAYTAARLLRVNSIIKINKI